MPLWLLFPFDYACAAMSSFIPAIRPFATPAVAAATQADARDSTGQSAAHSFPGYLFKAPRGSAAQYDQVSLSAQGLATSSLGASAPVAPIQRVASQLAESIGAALFAGADTGLQLNPDVSARLSGTSPIVTADGQRFEVEIDVEYRSNAQVTDAAGTPETPDTPDTPTLTGQALPAIKFPGSLNDLFKLLGRQLASDRGAAGDLTLRLTRLVDRAALLAPRQNDTALARASASNASKNAYVNAYASAAQLTDPADDTPS